MVIFVCVFVSNKYTLFRVMQTFWKQLSLKVLFIVRKRKVLFIVTPILLMKLAKLMKFYLKLFKMNVFLKLFK